MPVGRCSWIERLKLLSITQSVVTQSLAQSHMTKAMLLLLPLLLLIVMMTIMMSMKMVTGGDVEELFRDCIRYQRTDGSIPG